MLESAKITLIALDFANILAVESAKITPIALDSANMLAGDSAKEFSQDSTNQI